MARLLITGSREATPEMLELVDQLVLDAKADGDEVIVGDADGVDARAIYQCDLLKVPVTVYGAYEKLRRRAKTGLNYGLKGTYPQRDLYMAERCDVCVAVWSGVSRGTRITFEAAATFGKPVTVYDCSGPLSRKIQFNEVRHA